MPFTKGSLWDVDYATQRVPSCNRHAQVIKHDCRTFNNAPFRLPSGTPSMPDGINLYGVITVKWIFLFRILSPIYYRVKTHFFRRQERYTGVSESQCIIRTPTGEPMQWVAVDRPGSYSIVKCYALCILLFCRQFLSGASCSALIW